MKKIIWLCYGIISGAILGYCVGWVGAKVINYLVYFAFIYLGNGSPAQEGTYRLIRQFLSIVPYLTACAGIFLTVRRINNRFANSDLNVEIQNTTVMTSGEQ